MECLENLNWNFIHNTIVLLAVITAWAVPARMWRKQESARRREQTAQSQSVMRVLSIELKELASGSAKVLERIGELREYQKSDNSLSYKNPFNVGVPIQYWLTDSPLLGDPSAWCMHLPSKEASAATRITLAMAAYHRHAQKMADADSRTITVGQRKELRKALEKITEKADPLADDLWVMGMGPQ